MTFLHSQYLHLLWLGLIPVALWLFRRKAKRVQVSTLLFFRTLAREHQESAWLRRLKKVFSLLLTLLVILLAVLALARPFREGGGDTPKSLVVLLDCSASMDAKDADGKTRLDAAKDVLRDRLNALPENIITSLVVYGSEAEVMQSRSTNRRELLRMIDQAEVVPQEDRPEEALVVARRLAALDAPAEIWYASDRAFTPKEEPAGTATAASADAGKPTTAEPRQRFIDVALKETLNVGITGFQIRPAPLARNRFDVFVEVSASSANKAPMDVTLEARLDGNPRGLREFELKPGESTRIILPVEGGRGQRLEMELRAANDSLGWDNVVLAALPETKPLVVAWLAEAPDPFVELALTSLLAEDRIQVLKGGVKDWPLKEKPDVYVFENWLPTPWPTDRPALVLNPPRSEGPIHAKKLERPVPYDAVRAVQPEHPVLFRVTSNRAAVTQTTVLNVSDTLETLWMAGNEPVLAAGEAGGQRLVVTAFQPSRSEQLALLSAFPLLVGNAIYWCAEQAEALASLQPHHPGEVVQVAPGMVRWRVWDGVSIHDVSQEVNSGWMDLRYVGLFEDSKGRVQSSLLLSTRETDVPSAKADAAAPAAAQDNGVKWAGGGNWSTKLLWLALGILLLESWLFHRHAVY
ncbi:BatA and WFA domain-containing protein [Roseimicrobium sp. ORNL1]|uniref:vWA domain-containing protein n=1 Tax=Roseimicrobium sp. ORNL1 TaxID=2711231 RepID=UPI0013E108A4|nr:BatA and WFA domain-containing protein [Roseimicrobium sp. ORNL1]QIF03252.1 VWA domain-containing protein [Roseimicrobium sp. ORNL1]